MSSTPDQEFIHDFAIMSTFGATDGGGVDRQAATAPDGAQRAWLADWLTTRGFRIEFDSVGNQFGLYEFIPGAPYVLTGSHMDSQPLGGRYDGAYGVLASAHAAARVVEGLHRSATVPKFNIGVVNWFNEEGSRFKPSMMGSSVFTGKLPAAAALATPDARGVTVREALETIGTIGSYPGPQPAAYAEIHIEQGRTLENEGITIGLVESTWAAEKFEFIVHGDQSHTGSTIMADRKDALLGAALLTVFARELSERFSSRYPSAPLHTSVSEMTIEPNSPVVVAREVRLHLDMRSPDQSVAIAASDELLAQIPLFEKRANVAIKQVAAHSWGNKDYQRQGVKLAMEACEELGLTHREVMTVAGHDSVNMKDIVPTVMLFVPSVEGISHNEREFTRDEDACAGVDLLARVITKLSLGDL